MKKKLRDSFEGPKQAVIYCRVSSLKQTTDGDGIRSQETRCREFARMKRYEVIEVFRDEMSGSLIDRPGMKAMLAFMRKRRAKGTIVIIDDVSRLARGLQAHLELRQAIVSAGGVLESPSIEFGEDSDSLLVENLLASVSQHQRQKIGETTINRMRARVMNGFFVFPAPVGYRYTKAREGGRMLCRDEPVASVVQEALEGYASGRFETQADVQRFLQAHPAFPRTQRNVITVERVTRMLTQCAYAGYVEAPNWDVSRRPGHHEGLISYQAFVQIQERIEGRRRVPMRKNLNEDFSLRGFVVCGCCNTPLTACWSTGSHARYPYYLCPKRGCEAYGKSIRRERIEGEFEALLQSVQPTETLFRAASAMFEDLWSRRLAQAQDGANALAAQVAKVDRQLSQLLDRILDASVPSVIAAYEDRVRKLEDEKLLIHERMAGAGRPASNFNTALRTALNFVASPWKLWASGELEQRRTVLKLTFANRLQYVRDEGFRTADLSLPFKMLAGFSGADFGMASPAGFEPALPP